MPALLISPDVGKFLLKFLLQETRYSKFVILFCHCLHRNMCVKSEFTTFRV